MRSKTSEHWSEVINLSQRFKTAHCPDGSMVFSGRVES